MRRSLSLFALASALALGASAPTSAASSRSTSPTETRRSRTERLGRLPIACDFEANRGQTAPEVDYLARCAGYVAFLSRGDAVIRTGRDAFRLHLVGGRDATPSESLPRPGRSTYLIGDDAKRWHTDVPRYGRVEYDDVRSGVDLTYRIEGRAVAFDLLVAPGADTDGLAFRLDGVAWAGPDTEGNLSIGLPSGGSARLSAPRAWQEVDGVRRDVVVRFAEGAARNEVAFAVGAHDATRPLVIDPTLTVSTYLGGSSTEIGYAIAVDAGGAVYLAGQTLSSDFPTTTGALQTAKGDSVSANSDAFVSKFDRAGTSLVYETYLGGDGDENCRSIAVDSSGNAYVGGASSSSDFPLVNAYQTSGPAFLAKLASSGSSLIWSTFVNGTTVIDVGLDAAGNVYGLGSGRLMKFNPSATVRLYDVTSLAGGAVVDVRRMTVDPTGVVWLGGSTTSTGAGTTGAFQSSYAGGTMGSTGDAWIARIDTSGLRSYSTYLGGSGDESISDIALGPTGDVYVCGTTQSSNFPTQNAHQSTHGGYDDLFVARFDATATSLAWSTYLGGTGYDYATALAVDASGNAFVGGTATDSAFPASDGYQSSFGGGGHDAVIAEFGPGGSLTRASFLGGSGADFAEGIAISASGGPLLVGETESSDFPSTCSRQTRQGTSDAFLAGVAPASAVFADLTPSTLPGATLGYEYSGQVVVSGGTAPYAWTLHDGALPDGMSLASSGAISGTPTGPAGPRTFVAEVRDANTVCALRQFTLPVNPAPSVNATVMQSWTVGRDYDTPIPVDGGSAPFTATQASGTLPPGGVLAGDARVTAAPFTTSGTFTFSVHVVDRNGAAADGTLSITVNPAPTITTTSLPAWTAGRQYTQTLAAADGTQPFVWTVASGALPVAGGIIPTTGVLDGSALAAGDYSFTARLTDFAGATAEQMLTVHVNAPLQMTSPALPIAILGRPYAAGPATSGGTPPFTWTLTSGTFQAGFSAFDVNTGTVLGTPTEAGREPIVFRVTDATGFVVDRNYALVVAPLVDVVRGRARKETVPILVEDSTKDVVRAIEAIAGTRLDVQARRKDGPEIGLLVLDAAGTPLDVTPFTATRGRTVTIKAFPLPATGRYYVVVRPTPGVASTVVLDVAVKGPKSPHGDGAVDPAGAPFTVRFSVLDGSKVIIAVKAAKESPAVPTITSLRDADGNDLLVAEELRTSRKGAVLKPTARLAGGDFVATFDPGAGLAGAITWKIAVQPPRGYRFEMPDVTVTSE